MTVITCPDRAGWMMLDGRDFVELINFDIERKWHIMAGSIRAFVVE